MVPMDLSRESLVDSRWAQSRMSKGQEEARLLLDTALEAERTGGEWPAWAHPPPVPLSECLNSVYPAEVHLPGTWEGGLWGAECQGRVGRGRRASRGMRVVGSALCGQQAPLVGHLSSSPSSSCSSVLCSYMTTLFRLNILEHSIACYILQ